MVRTARISTWLPVGPRSPSEASVCRPAFVAAPSPAGCERLPSVLLLSGAALQLDRGSTSSHQHFTELG